jgi:mono/diheme cytochrome c family protein
MRILMMLWVSVSLLSAQRTVWDGVYTESQADKGSELYDEHCEVCHGDTINARDGGPTLLGAEFRSNWDGKTLGDFYERIRSSMPLQKPQSLDRTVLANIVAYLLRINAYPSGKTELIPNRENLAGIKFLAYPPK